MNTQEQADHQWIRKPKKVWSFAKDWKVLQGEHIALAGPNSDTIVAHGKDAREVLAVARQYVERPVLTVVPQGGWASFLCSNSQAG